MMIHGIGLLTVAKINDDPWYWFTNSSVKLLFLYSIYEAYKPLLKAILRAQKILHKTYFVCFYLH